MHLSTTSKLGYLSFNTILSSVYHNDDKRTVICFVWFVCLLIFCCYCCCCIKGFIYIVSMDLLHPLITINRKYENTHETVNCIICAHNQ